MGFPTEETWPPDKMELDLGGLRIVPIVHGRLEFAIEVRRQIFEYHPQAVAVELPETLYEPVIRAVRRLPFISVVHYQTAGGDPAYLPVEPCDGVVEAMRLALEAGMELRLVDRDGDGIENVMEWIPDPYAISRIGSAQYCRRLLSSYGSRPVPPEDEAREETMAYHLGQLQNQYDRVLFVCGFAHVAGVIKALPTAVARPLGRVRRERVLVSALHHDSIRECLAEPPYLTRAYEEARRSSTVHQLDRMREAVSLVQEATKQHLENSGETVSPKIMKTLFRFARNYALVEGGLAPDLYQLLVAAKGCVDDNFAYEVWDLATSYHYIESPPTLPVIRLGVEDLYKHARHIRFHRKLKNRRMGMLRMIKKRKREKKPGDWKKKWKGLSICSHPPEDLVIEGYGAFLRKKAKGILSQEYSRVEPFQTSLLDGIDMRETLRNWHERKIYVRENRPVRGEVGAVVVIFDPDVGAHESYPWRMTWQGEHEQESDMALYATEPGDQVIGPGISRCEYGGMVMTYPPGRMYYVWEDPYLAGTHNKAERLLLAGLVYALDRMVVYVAEKPPGSRMRTIAARLDKKLLYVPSGQLSPLTLKKIRVFHVLDGHHVRSYAGEFIW